MPLHVVALPIGNAGDLSPRAVEVLRRVDFVYAEDTRRASRVLSEQGVRATLRPYHDHSDPSQRRAILDALREGREIALISDAGTPCISDPGYKLVAEARAQALPVSPVPGPSAITAFLSAAGLPTDRFAFLGFPPRKAGAREAFLSELLGRRETVVLYESPRRLLALLQQLQSLAPQRPVVVARELTKTYEEWFSGDASEVHAALSRRERILGEFVVGVAGSAPSSASPEALRVWASLLAETSMAPREAAAVLARGLALGSSEAYDAIVRARSGPGDG